MLLNLIAVGAGGALGSMARYLVGVSLLISPGAARFPYGTLVVNVLGCLCIGAVAGAIEARAAFSPEVRLFLMVGVLGGFTTFSAFGYETLQLARGEVPWLALANVTLQVVLGLLAAGVGWWLAGGR